MTTSDRALEQLAQLPNLGPASARMLAKAGIGSVHQWKQLGPLAAYQLVLASGQNPSLNLLWAMVGAEQGLHWSKIPQPLKDAYLRELER